MDLFTVLYIKMLIGVQNFFEDEDGDTNLISIIIVLGIVLALVVVFRGYISKIIQQIGSAVDSFKNEAF